MVTCHTTAVVCVHFKNSDLLFVVALEKANRVPQSAVELIFFFFFCNIICSHGFKSAENVFTKTRRRRESELEKKTRVKRRKGVMAN